MNTLYTSSSIRKTFSVRIVSITFTWLLGLFAGACLLRQTPFASLMCSMRFSRISIIGLFLSLAIPLLLSYILLSFTYFYIILPLVFFKAFSFICSYGGLMIGFGNAGWLVSGMILLSDFFVVLSLLVQWFNAAKGERLSFQSHLALHILIPAAIGCFDYFVVSPYAAMLLNY